MGTSPPPLGHYRQAVRSDGPILHVAGQVAVDERGETVGRGDPGAQAAQVGSNLVAVLEDHGATARDVVALRVYVTDMAAAAAWAAVRGGIFAVDPPASTLVRVAGLARDDWLLEVEAVACLER